MLFVIALICFGGLAFYTIPVYIDLYHARRGEPTTFDGPQFFPLKLFALLIPLSFIIVIIYVLFQ